MRRKGKDRDDIVLDAFLEQADAGFSDKRGQDGAREPVGSSQYPSLIFV